MSETKPLDYTEKTVTTLAIIGGLLLFLFTLTKCQSTSNLFSKDAAGTTELEGTLAGIADQNAVAATTPDGLVLEDSVEKKVTLLERDLSAKEAKFLELEGSLSDAKDNNILLQNKLNRLNAQLAAKTDTKATALPLPVPLPSNDGKLKDEIKSLTAQNKELAKELKTLKNSSSLAGDDLDSLKRKVTALNTERDALQRSAEEKEAELQKEIDSLSASIKSGESNDVLKAEIAKTEALWKKKLEDFQVKSELDKSKYTNSLKSQLDNLRVALRKEKAKKVFANSSDDLAPAAQTLIKTLDNYKGETEAELAKTYSGIQKNIGGRPKLVVNFETGVSSVTADQVEKVNALIKSAKPNTYFMAVGYADTAGSAASNKKLSSKRATKVAEVIKPTLGGSQFVQAYYLGQTARFGPAENNRVVEIWEINQ